MLLWMEQEALQKLSNANREKILGELVPVGFSRARYYIPASIALKSARLSCGKNA